MPRICAFEKRYAAGVAFGAMHWDIAAWVEQRILPLRQWYLGLRAALRLIDGQLAACPPHQLMAKPGDILVMFDKRACHARLAAAGVAVPRCLGPVGSYDELLQTSHKFRAMASGAA